MYDFHPKSKCQVGVRFGRLTVLGRAPTVKYHNGQASQAYCRCDCGTERIFPVPNLIKKKEATVSCGCYAAENASRVQTTHGMTDSPAYRSWLAMRQRCTRPTDIGYHLYGGRGITVCPEWLEGFEAFHRDMGDRPEGTTLERNDSNGNYEPGNCRWATYLDQANNTSKVNRVTIHGETMSVSVASRKYGISRTQLRNRMRDGMTPEQAVDTPVDYASGARRKSNNAYVDFAGERLMMCELAERTTCSDSHLRYYLRQGLTAEQAVERILTNRFKKAEGS